MAEQQSFNFDRGRKLRAIEQAELPKVVRLPSGKGISAKAMSAVLTAIDKCARHADTCCVRLSRLAGLARLSEDHCGRTIQALEVIFLVAVTRRFARSGQLESEYRICWGNLEELVQVDPRSLQTDLRPLQTDLRSPPQTDPGSDRYSKDLSSSKISKNTTTNQGTTARLENSNGGDGGHFFARQVPSAATRKAERGNVGSGVRRVESLEDAGHPGPAWKVGWLQPEQFETRAGVDQLFERMVELGQGDLTADDRERFYAVVLTLRRENRTGKIKSLVGVFRSLFSGDRGPWLNRADPGAVKRARELMQGY